MQRSMRTEKANLRLASLGAMLEYYDFVAYVYVAARIGEAFFPSDASATVKLAQTLAIYATGYFVRPVAGIMLSRVADRVGRKRIFLLTLALMSASTLGIGVLPTYDSVGWWAPALLLAMRVLQGCAVGGELPGAAVFVAEHATARRVAYSGAVLQSMAYGGFLIGAGAAFFSQLLVEHVVPGEPSLAWRLPFVLGGLLGAVAVHLRRRLEETPLFTELGARGAAAKPVTLVLREHRKPALFGLLIVFAMTMLNGVYFQYWPTYLQVQLHYSPGAALAASLIAITGAMVSMPLWGRAADHWGWQVSLLIGSLSLAVATIWLFAFLPALGRGSAWALWAALPAAVAAGSIVSATPGLVASIFPTAVRQSGYALPYNSGVAVFGGPLTLVLVWLISAFGVSSPGYVVLLACLVAAAAALWVRRIPLHLGVSAMGSAAESAETLLSGTITTTGGD
jgi:MFS transporter, MHS family, proline/betaine transporter